MSNWDKINKYQPIKSQLDAELDSYMKQNPTTTLSASRRQILSNAKNKGLIDDYRACNSRGGQPKPNNWGGSAGFDSSFTIYKI